MLIPEYIRYIKDNPKGYWFKAKLYGWGWVPVRWQGWLIVLLFVGFLLWNGMTLEENPALTDAELNMFFVRLGVAIFILIAICWRTGETPRWNWGVPKKK